MDENSFESLRHHITQLLLPHGLTVNVGGLPSHPSASAHIEVYVADTKYSPCHEVAATKPEALCDQAGHLAFNDFVLNEAIPKLRPKR